MTKYNFEAYPTEPESMAKYLHEREAAGKPITRAEGEAYIEWSLAKEQEITERKERMSPAERAGHEGFQREEELMGAIFDLEDARSTVEALVEAAEDAERAAAGKRPLKRERDIVAPKGFSGMGVTPRGW